MAVPVTVGGPAQAVMHLRIITLIHNSQLSYGLLQLLLQ
jgi:hypothetical protein